jgi:hypothetical protein
MDQDHHRAMAGSQVVQAHALDRRVARVDDHGVGCGRVRRHCESRGKQDQTAKHKSAKGRVVAQFEKSPKGCHSEARDCRARNLLFRCWRQADSSPIKLASE